MAPRAVGRRCGRRPVRATCRRAQSFWGLGCPKTSREHGDTIGDHAMRIGVNEYLGKPYQEEELFAKIKTLTSEEPIGNMAPLGRAHGR